MLSNTELAKLRKQAELLARAGNWGQAALEINKKMLEIDEHASDALTRLGRCHQEDRNFICAYEMYKQALVSDPSNTVARNKLELVKEDAKKQQEKKRQETRKQQKEARLQKQINNISSMTNYNEIYQFGLAKKERGHFDLAIAAFLRATELNPESPYAWTSLGSAYRHNSNTAEAYRAYERALELVVDKDVVLVGMAAVMHTSGDTATAIELYNEVLKHDQNNVYALNGLAAVYSSIGDIEMAGKLFGRVYYLTDKDVNFCRVS